MTELKNIKIDVETWKKLQRIKIESGLKRVADVIKQLVADEPFCNCGNPLLSDEEKKIGVCRECE